MAACRGTGARRGLILATNLGGYSIERAEAERNDHHPIGVVSYVDPWVSEWYHHQRNRTKNTRAEKGWDVVRDEFFSANGRAGAHHRPLGD